MQGRLPTSSICAAAVEASGLQQVVHRVRHAIDLLRNTQQKLIRLLGIASAVRAEELGDGPDRSQRCTKFMPDDAKDLFHPRNRITKPALL